MTDKPKTTKLVDRLHSNNPVDAAWRRQQAQVDADIERLARNPEIERLFDQMEAERLTWPEKIKRLKAYLRAAQKRVSNVRR